jgi:hypothetical protein
MSTPTPIRPGASLAAPVATTPALRSNRDTHRLGGTSALYIGKFGTGKTRNMLSWPRPVWVQTAIEKTTLSAHPEDLPVIEVTTWDEWRRVVPFLRSRAKLLELVRKDQRFTDYEPLGLIMDDWTSLAEMAHNQGNRESGGDTRAAYGFLLNAMLEAKDVLFACTRWSEPFYFTSAIHEREKWKTVNNVEVVDEVIPTIAGQFGEQKFFMNFGTVLWAMREAYGTPDGGLQRGKAPKFYCRTDQIDAYRRGFDRWGKLPAEVAGDFNTLAGYWFGEGK